MLNRGGGIHPKNIGGHANREQSPLAFGEGTSPSRPIQDPSSPRREVSHGQLLDSLSQGRKPDVICKTREAKRISKGQILATRDDLIGCRVNCFLNKDSVLVTHFGPYSINDTMKSIDQESQEKPERIVVFSLADDDYLQGMSWRPISLEEYHKTEQELLERLSQKYPGVLLEKATYQIDSQVVVDFSGDQPKIFSQKLTHEK